MRKIPIDGTSGGGPGSGFANNPSYSVSVSDNDAKAAKAKYEADKDAKRMYPKHSDAAPADITKAVSSGLELLPGLVVRKLQIGSQNMGLVR